MSLSVLEYLRHIRDEADYLMAQAQRVTKETFIQDETLKRAFVRSLEIIGEAAKKIPSDFRQQYSSIDWKALAGDEGSLDSWVLWRGLRNCMGHRNN